MADKGQSADMVELGAHEVFDEDSGDMAKTYH